MRFSSFVACVIAGLLSVGCATKPKPVSKFAVNPNIVSKSFIVDEQPSLTAYRELDIKPRVVTADDFFDPKKPEQVASLGSLRGSFSKSGRLSGRTIRVKNISDIQLHDKEVVLTFDDGPVPIKTPKILATLDQFGVKATFLMVGQMVKAHPALARSVEAKGHSIGSHTYSHKNLGQLGHQAAMDEIRKGERAILSAGLSVPTFFRFPYLADTNTLRRELGARGTVILDVDVDSKDYFKVSPTSVINHTMKRLHAKGRGIILMHDLHSRTASMLPQLLTRLRAEGYKVVTLKGGGGSNDLLALN